MSLYPKSCKGGLYVRKCFRNGTFVASSGRKTEEGGECDRPWCDAAAGAQQSKLCSWRPSDLQECLSMAAERTFIMVKPDGLERGLSGEVIRSERARVRAWAGI